MYARNPLASYQGKEAKHESNAADRVLNPAAELEIETRHPTAALQTGYRRKPSLFGVPLLNLRLPSMYLKPGEIQKSRSLRSSAACSRETGFLVPRKTAVYV
jgi:hypothetical protein